MKTKRAAMKKGKSGKGGGGSLSNAQPRASRAVRLAARSAAREAKTVPQGKRGPRTMVERLADFLLRVSNAEHHREALKANRLHWGRDISPRMKPRHALYDKDFTEAYGEAKKAGEEFRQTLIEDSAAEKAMYGWDEPVFGSLGGEMGTGEVGKKRVFSESLHLALIKRNPRYAEVLNVNLNSKRPEEMTDEEIEAAAARIAARRNGR